MITQSGIHVQTIGGATGTPTAMDIAVHAGRLCRFGGSVWYPLLPHLVFVGLLAYRRSKEPINLLWGFLHDAHECVTGDVPRPFKCDCMRREQDALDGRILDAFFPNDATVINFELVHECDYDACDLEAVELGLPNYAAIVTQAASSYERTRPKVIYDDPEDAALLRRILRGPFYRDTIYKQSDGVQAFARALDLAKAGNHRALMAEIDRWELLSLSPGNTT
jgi:hypothetical protein